MKQREQPLFLLETYWTIKRSQQEEIVYVFSNYKWMVHTIAKEATRYLNHSLSCKATDMVLCQNINGSNCIKTLNASVALNASKSKNILYNRKGH